MSIADLILRNAAVPGALLSSQAPFTGIQSGDCLLGDLLISGGRVAGMVLSGTIPAAGPEQDLAGRIVLPRLTEAHCHLDKCHTVNRIAAVGGDLHAAIKAQLQDKARWNAEDIRRRALRGLSEFEQAGCGAVRTHVDWDADQIFARQVPVGLGVLGELAAEWADRLLLQRSVLMPVDVFANRQAAEWAVRQVARESGALLGVFVFNQPEKRAWLRVAFELAAEYSLPLDFHVDEGLVDGLDGLVTIAELALETHFELPIVCGHACSLANLNGEHLQRVLDTLVAARIGIVSLPITNLYLQDRQNGTPRQRGITRVRELSAAGVPVMIGSDNVCDAFCPIGAHDPMAALAIAALGAHLDPPYGRWLKAITIDARRMLGLPPLYLDGCTASDLLVSNATSTAELVAGAPRYRLAM